MFYRKYRLDRFQEEAIMAIEQNHSVIVSAPTGTGKTLIAEYVVEKHLNANKQIIYTAPIKALINQKYRDFNQDYGDRVGIITGDVVINPEAPALIMTTEIFRNTIFENPDHLRDVPYVILDEIHYMDDTQRGTVWEESIIFAPQHINFLCLSATISNLEELAKWMRSVRNNSIDVILETERPVPLEHKLYIKGYGFGDLNNIQRIQSCFQHKPILQRGLGNISRWTTTQFARTTTTNLDELDENDLIQHIQKSDQLPCLYFLLSRKSCEEKASENIDRKLLDPNETNIILDEYDQLCERYGIKDNKNAEQLREFLSHGVAYHHAGMLPTLKEIIERLFTLGYVKLLFTTETFSLGINMPTRTVVFDSIAKYDGVQFRSLKTREYQQMAGRAGRRGIDKKGFVYLCVDPEFDEYESVKQIVSDDIEGIESQFNLSYSSILNLYDKYNEQIYEVCRKSLRTYQNSNVSDQIEGLIKKVKEKNDNGTYHYDKIISELVQGIESAETYQHQQVERKLKVLDDLGYIDKRRLTDKGKIASKIFGYELHITESLLDGDFYRLDPDQLCILIMAIVFESRKDCRYEKMRDKVLLPIISNLDQKIEIIRKKEKALGIDKPIKELDPNLGSATLAWSTGCNFDRLAIYTDATQGDLVRYFRMGSELLRQTRGALSDDDKLIDKINTCILKINRDIVNAEKQLRSG